MDLIKLLQEGDATGLEMQKAQEALDHAKKAVEQAKERFELTKNYFEQVVAKADEAGIPRAKFKKLIEERVVGLWNSGLLNQIEEKVTKAPKAPRAAKKAKEDVVADSIEADIDEEFSRDESTEAAEQAMAN